MGIFNEFNKKEKPVFTGSRFGFGFGTSGIAEVSSSFVATGGQITPGSATANGYTYHVFDQANSPETFQVTDAGDNLGYIEVLIVGGGGGGGGRGGGGGAGGVVYKTYQVTAAATMPVSVGAGGAGGSGNPGSDGTTGSNTVFVNPLEPSPQQTVTMGGGGGGGGGGRAGLSNTNGSSGGAGRDANAGPQGVPTTQFGYPGGGSASNNNNGAGGGGGATGAGTRGCGPSTPMEGPGVGGCGAVYPGFGGPLISPPGSPNPRIPSPVRTAITSAGFYGAGGGGGSGGSTADPTASFRRMGIGGLGQRVDDGQPQPSADIDGIDLTGSGGGGGGDGPPYAGGTGGDGVVIVRYRKRGDGSDDVGTVNGPDGSRNVKAVGGVIEFTSTTTIHYFVQPGTFVVNTALPSAMVLVVGGGGSGGDRHGGGGGAGGVVYGPDVSLPAATYSVTVGAGGAQEVKGVNLQGRNGGDSVFGAPPPSADDESTHFRAFGGGGGGSYPAAPLPGKGGGCGGGGGGENPGQKGDSPAGFSASGSPHPLPYGTVIRYGGNGGRGYNGPPDYRNGGGGGGAGGNGSSQPDGSEPAGQGAPGRAFTIGGNPYYFAGGGGGGRWNAHPNTQNGGAAGSGGGGAGGMNGPGEEGGAADQTIPGGGGHWLAPHFPTSSQNGGAQIGGPSQGGHGVVATGGGGGGQGQGAPYTATNPTGTGGCGGPGIVIIEYPS